MLGERPLDGVQWLAEGVTTEAGTCSNPYSQVLHADTPGLEQHRHGTHMVEPRPLKREHPELFAGRLWGCFVDPYEVHVSVVGNGYELVLGTE
jgi:hypothetical protein